MSASDLSEERKLNLVSSMLEAIHIVTALEALSLGAKTGIDIGTLFTVINGAAGNSAMFAAAGRELILGQTEGQVDSLDAFIAQTAEVMSVARAIKFPSPLANQAEQLLLAARPFATPDASAAVSLANFFQMLSGGKIAPGTSTVEQPAEGTSGSSRSATGAASASASSESSSSSSAGKVAFLGLGAMGQGMAASIVRAGIPLSGYDVYPPSLEAFVKAGGTAARSAREACEGADVVVLMVVSIDQATELLLGKADGKGDQEGIAHLLAPGATVILSSTCPPSATLVLSHRLSSLQNKPLLVDAPVSGGTIRAANGDLSIMVGGDEAAIAKGRAVLEAMTQQAKGPDQRLFIIPGGVTAGSSVKMVNQLCAAVHVAALAEAMAFAAKLELPLRKVFAHVNASKGASWMFANRVPHMLEGDLHPFSAADILIKDIGIVLSEAAVLGSPALMTSVAHYPFLFANGAGWGREDDSGIVRIWEATGIRAHRKAEPL